MAMSCDRIIERKRPTGSSNVLKSSFSIFLIRPAYNLTCGEIMRDQIILVTGATGRQGSTAVRHLLEAGFKVRGLTREPNKLEAKRLEDLGAEMVEGNLDDPAKIRQDLNGCYGVFAVFDPVRGGGGRGDQAR